MLSAIRFHVFGFALLTMVLCAVPLGAQQQQSIDASPAPVPPAIFSAKKVFLSNGGADSGLFPHPFSGSQDRVYNQFYASMQKWGRYELVSEPNEADLVFEVRLAGPNGPTNPDKQKARPIPFRSFVLRLSIGNPTTRFGR
jgi:hypothetical protein